MAVTFNGTTIVSDSFGAMYGEQKFSRGGRMDEYEQWSIARANGIGETFCGNREAIHTLQVRYFSNDEDSLVATLYALQVPELFTLGVDAADGGGPAYYEFCRMLTPQFGQRQAGTRGATRVVCIDITLRFLQHLVTA